MSEWENLGGETLFKGNGGRSVVRETWRMGNGEEDEFDIKIEADAICIVALTKEGDFLVAEQMRLGPQKKLKELPGGYHDAGGSPREAVMRELLEETGYAPESLEDVELIGTTFVDAWTRRTKYGYIARNCIKVDVQKLEPTEDIKVHQLSPQEFIELALSMQMTDAAVALAGLERLGYLRVTSLET